MRYLIAEDDPEWQRFFQTFARAANVKHDTVSDWVSVYSKLKTGSIDRLILDLALESNVDAGIAELINLSNEYSVKVLVTTAWIENNNLHRCVAIPGVLHLIRKPKIFERLSDVCEFFDYHPEKDALDRTTKERSLRFLQMDKTGKGRDESKNVFVVHGRDGKLRSNVFQFLRSIGLHPIEWGNAIELSEDPAPYIKAVLEGSLDACGAVLVLLSPDDKVRLRKELCSPTDTAHETSFNYQARPNVFFELGLAMATHPKKVVLAEAQRSKLLSDIDGIHRVRLNNTPESRNELAARLAACGCDVDTRGSDWLSVGDFTGS